MFDIMGGTKTMCCLVGFKLRVGAYSMLLAEEEYVRKVVSKGLVPSLTSFKKMAVVDLFKWATPTEQVDLVLRDNADRLAKMLVQNHKSDVHLWNEVPVVHSAQKALQLAKTLKAQQEVLKKKQERELARLEKKKEREDAKKKKEEQQRLLREKRALNKQKKKLQTKKNHNDRRNFRRKRDREITAKVTKDLEAKSRKVQRVALSSLADQHKSQLKILADKHVLEVKDLQSQIAKLKENLSESQRINEQTKMQATIDTLRSELQLLRKTRLVAPTPATTATCVESSSSSSSKQRGKSGALTRANSVGSASSSSVGSLGSSTDTPLDPNCGTPYDPLAPVCAPPIHTTGRPTTGGGYHYMARHIMRGSYPPSRRQLRYTPPPNYGEYNREFGGWY